MAGNKSDALDSVADERGIGLPVGDVFYQMPTYKACGLAAGDAAGPAPVLSMLQKSGTHFGFGLAGARLGEAPRRTSYRAWLRSTSLPTSSDLDLPLEQYDVVAQGSPATRVRGDDDGEMRWTDSLLYATRRLARSDSFSARMDSGVGTAASRATPSESRYDLALETGRAQRVRCSSGCRRRPIATGLRFVARNCRCAGL